MEKDLTHLDLNKMTNKTKLLSYTLCGLLVVVAILSVILGIRKCSTNNSTLVSVSDLPSDVDIAFLESILGNNKTLYGLNATDYNVELNEIESGQTFSKLLNQKYNVNIAVVNKLIEFCKGKFDLRDIRAGHPYAAFIADDSTSVLHYLVYEKSRSEFITFGTGDSVYIDVTKKDIVTEEKYIEGAVESTLYESVGPALASKLADIYESTIDFTTIQKGDRYRILYQEQFIDTVKVGVGKVYGVEFSNRGKPYIAIRYEQGETVGYWDENGNSMKKAFLRAPLSFKARVSSKFGMRVHPIKRIRQQHNGIDYAAPKGTPVLAVADGVISGKGWDGGGGGNMLWIRHAKGLESGYLHLSQFSKGIGSGTRVRKGQVIAYVGSTGRSTGPHLDFRIRVNGRYINPDKLPTTPGDPIKSANRAGFKVMKKDVLAVMDEYQK